MSPDVLVDRWRRRLDLLLPTVLLTVLAFVQKPGLLAADTKLDLVVDPGGFLARALAIWDPTAAGGQLQNQAYGYLFPMGPFFWLGEALGLPGWVVQRCWWALLLVLGYHGARLVLERLGIGTGWSRVIGAFAYATAPRMLIGLGAISSEIWPMALAPWVLLPLLAPAPGRERRAALRSGLAVLLIGAVNAVATLAVLVLPAWWILTRTGAVRRRLAAWWALAVGLACAWWIGPLLVLGRSSPPFLDWIEDSRVTTSGASVTEALRGTTQWIPALGGTRPVWPSGWIVLTSANVVALGLVVVLTGLVGLATARGSWTLFARGGLALGLVLVTLGHLGPATGPWAGVFADLLDGPLAPFRNSHKFEPVLRLPVVLGVAAFLPLALRWATRRRAPWPAIGPALVVVAIVGQAAAPALAGVIQRGPFEEVPPAWADTARWLADHPDGGRALVLPGGNAPARFWGEPKDEPIQPYASTPWMVRDGVPLGSAAATRLLDEVEQQVAQGRGGAELLRTLGLLGVTRVVLAGDHARPAGSRTTPPLVVRAALEASGARSVAAFGPFVGGTTQVTLASDYGLDRPVRMVEVLDVPTRTSVAPSRTVPLSAAVGVTGGPEGVSRLPGGGPVVLAADAASTAALNPHEHALTDTLQRRQASFSVATDVYGPLLRADQAYPSARAVHDYWPAPLTERTVTPDEQSVRVEEGAARAEASSSLDEPGLGQQRDLGADAARAFDGSGETGWRSAGLEARGQWVEARWGTPTTLPSELTVVLDTERGADVAALVVTTDAGSVRTPVTTPSLAGDVDPARYPVRVAVPPGATRSIRLTVAAVRGASPSVRVLDIGAGAVPRVVTGTRLPLAGAGADVIALAATADDRAGCYPLADGTLACSPDRRREGEEETTMRRSFTLDRAHRYGVSGTAVATSVGADLLLRRPDGIRAVASSRWLPEPGVSPELAVDGDPTTFWASDPDETRPVLTVSWPGVRRVTGLRLTTDAQVAGRRPTQVSVTLGGRTVRRAVGEDGTLELPATRASRVTIRVLATTTQESVTLFGARPMPVVVGEVALLGQPWTGVVPRTSPVVVPCGLGPTLQVDGAAVPTTVVTTRQGLLTRAPADLRACAPVVAGAGAHRLQTLASGQFAVRSLLLDGRRTVTGAPPATSAVAVRSWGRTSRTLDVLTASPTPQLVVVRENANTGWVATLGGTRLTPVTVDGWAQAWVVPAGAHGLVRLEYGPQRAYAATLAAGGLAAVLLVLAVALGLRRRGSAPVAVAAEVRGRAVAPALLGGLVVLAGGAAGAVAVAVAVGATWLGRRGRSGWVAVAVAVLGAAWVGWSALGPWPRTLASNRDLVSGALGLALVALAVVRTRPLGGHPAGPGLDGPLDDEPAEAGDDDRGGEGEQGRRPEAPLEDVEAEELAHPEHERQVPEEDAVADRAEVRQHP